MMARSTKIIFYGEDAELRRMGQALFGHDVAAMFPNGQRADVQPQGNGPAIQALTD
jgi:hypothetical protein